MLYYGAEGVIPYMFHEGFTNVFFGLMYGRLNTLVTSFGFLTHASRCTMSGATLLLTCGFRITRISLTFRSRTNLSRPIFR